MHAYFKYIATARSLDELAISMADDEATMIKYGLCPLERPACHCLQQETLREIAALLYLLQKPISLFLVIDTPHTDTGSPKRLLDKKGMGPLGEKFARGTHELRIGLGHAEAAEQGAEPRLVLHFFERREIS